MAGQGEAESRSTGEEMRMTLCLGLIVVAASGIGAIVLEHRIRIAIHRAERRGENTGFLDGVKSERRFHP